jgi:hypothetical protein
MSVQNTTVAYVSDIECSNRVQPQSSLVSITRRQTRILLKSRINDQTKHISFRAPTTPPFPLNARRGFSLDVFISYNKFQLLQSLITSSLRFSFSLSLSLSLSLSRSLSLSFFLFLPISKLAETHLHHPSSCILNPIHQTD